MNGIIPRRQLPPTAGLPVRWRDLVGRRADFATLLAGQLGIPHPALTCSGTAALIVALRTLQARNPQRNEVIVAAWTCPLVALAAHYCPPVRIVPCDLQPDSIELDPLQLASLCGPRTLAVIVTHLAGRVADVPAAVHIAAGCGAAVIEDAAQALGASAAGKSVGLAGDIGFFSLALGKGLTTFEGGILFSRSPALNTALAARVKHDLHWHPGWELRRIVALWASSLVYHPDRFDWVYGRPQRKALSRGDLTAAVGDDFGVGDIPLHSLGKYRQQVAAAALPRLPAWQNRLRQQALRRVAELEQRPGIRVIQDPADRCGTWPFILLLMPDRASRDRALAALWCAGLGVTRLFINVLQHAHAAAAFCLPVSTPNAEDFTARSLTISNSHWVSDPDFSRILTALDHALGLQGSRQPGQ